MHKVLDFDYLQLRKMMCFGFQELQLESTALITKYFLNFP